MAAILTRLAGVKEQNITGGKENAFLGFKGWIGDGRLPPNLVRHVQSDVPGRRL